MQQALGYLKKEHKIDVFEVVIAYFKVILEEIKTTCNTEYTIVGESAALGWFMPWANGLFSKSMKGKILNFLHEVEKMISVISKKFNRKN